MGNIVNIPRDKLWKAAIEDLAAPFLLYFFKDWAEENVDFNKPIEFYDKELMELYPVPEGTTKFADKLLKVHLKDGSEQWVLVHVEVQGNPDPLFTERMFLYYIRIRERWKKEVISLAILTDERKNYKPSFYKHEFMGTSIEYRFNMFKVLEKKVSELEMPGNPFGIVMLTARKALMKTNLDDHSQIAWKSELVKKMLAMTIPRQVVRMMLIFIKHYVNFNEAIHVEQYNNELQTLIKHQKTMSLQELVKEEYTKFYENLLKDEIRQKEEERRQKEEERRQKEEERRQKEEERRQKEEALKQLAELKKRLGEV